VHAVIIIILSMPLWRDKHQSCCCSAATTLSVHQPIKFQLSVLVYKSWHTLAPQLHSIWSTTVNLLLRPAAMHTSSFLVALFVSVIGRFLSLDHVRGTVFRSTFANLILVYCNSIERYKRFCKNVFVRFEIRDFVTLSLYTWWLFDYRRYRNVMCFTYLLT